MPTMVNPHRRIVQVPEHRVEFAKQQGCVMATLDDIAYAGDTTAELFAIPTAPTRIMRDNIEKIDCGELGTRPVVVMGAGPSRVDVEGMRGEAFILGVNPRADGPRVDAAIALDDEYWQTHFLDYVERHGIPKRLHCHYKSIAAPRQAYRTGIPLNPETGDRGDIAIRINGIITTLQLTGIWALTVARYLTAGTIYCAGFDLSEKLYEGQAERWRLALRYMDNVEATPSLTGPVAEMLSGWRGSNFGFSVVYGVKHGQYGDRTVYVIGNGPSACEPEGDAVKIGVNWRGEFAVDHTIAADPQYWEHPDARPRGLLHNVLRSEIVPEGVGYTVPASSKPSDPYTMLLQNQSVHCGPACGLALGLYASKGPVVLLGCDALDEQYARQRNKLKLVSEHTRRVYVDDRMDGEAAQHFPVWASSYGDPSVALIVASGPSASREKVREALRKHRPGQIWAVNAALDLIGNPTDYLANDPDAIEANRRSYAFAEKSGTRLHVGNQIPKDAEISYHGRCAGTFAMRKAVEAGARKLVVLGVDGWDESQYSYTRANGEKGSRQGANEAMADCIADLEANNDLVIYHESGGPVWRLLEERDGN